MQQLIGIAPMSCCMFEGDCSFSPFRRGGVSAAGSGRLIQQIRERISR